MDLVIAPEVRKRRLLKRGAIIVAVLVLLGALAVTALERVRPSIRRSELQTARVARGSVEATLQGGGIVVPITEQVVSSPLEARVLRATRRAGDRVRTGDELLALDTASARLEAERLDDRLAQRRSETAQLRLRLDETIATVEAQLEQRALDAQILHYTAEQKEKLRTSGLIAEQDALAAAAAAKKSDIELRQLREALIRARRSREVQLAAAATDEEIAVRERDESKRQLDLAMLRAARDGVVTWILTEEGATVRRGDVVARIADLSAYRVAGTISDVHAPRLAAGMPAIVKIGELSLPGSIESVDPRIENGVAKFFVRLSEPAHAALRNNLRVDVSLVTGRGTSSLVVRRGALGRTSANEAFVVRGGDAVRVPVRFGVAGDDAIEITSGLREGDEVVISDMSDFEGIEKVRIE
jgi:HlyD family secretion protein